MKSSVNRFNVFIKGTKTPIYCRGFETRKEAERACRQWNALSKIGFEVVDFKNKEEN